MHSGLACESKQKVQHRGLSVSSSIASDEDDDLVLFSDIHRREREHKASIPKEPPLQTLRSYKSADYPLHSAPAATIRTSGYGADDIFSSDCGKTDYDWLMTPPGTPLLASVDGDSISTGRSRVGAASVRPALKTSKLGNLNLEPHSRAEHRSKNVRSNLGLQQPLNVNGIGSLSSTCSKPSKSGGPRSSTQGSNLAVRLFTPSSSHTIRHAPVGAIASTRPSLASAGTPQATMQIGSVCAVTPSAQATFPSGRSACSSRPLTPVKWAHSPSHPCNPPTTLVRCSSASRATSTLAKGPTLSRACSQTSKAWFPEALHGFSQERPPNLRTSMPERVLSNPKGWANKTFQFERADAGAPNKRHSSSSIVAKGPSFSTAQNRGKVTHMNAELNASAARIPEAKCLVSKVGVTAGRSQGGQSVVLDSYVQKPGRSTSLRDVKSIFSSIRESSGLGQNLSRKSVDLTPRHMDVCKSTPQKLRSFMSSMSKPRGLGRLGVKGSGNLGPHIKGTVLDSPMATSSSASSEHNMSIVIDPEGSEMGEETVSSERGRSLAASQHELFLLGKDKRITSWLGSPDYRDDDADIMQIFEQEGLDSLSGPESPLCSELDGTIECEDLSPDPI